MVDKLVIHEYGTKVKEKVEFIYERNEDGSVYLKDKDGRIVSQGETVFDAIENLYGFSTGKIDFEIVFDVELFDADAEE